MRFIDGQFKDLSGATSVCFSADDRPRKGHQEAVRFVKASQSSLSESSSGYHQLHLSDSFTLPWWHNSADVDQRHYDVTHRPDVMSSSCWVRFSGRMTRWLKSVERLCWYYMTVMDEIIARNKTERCIDPRTQIRAIIYSYLSSSNINENQRSMRYIAHIKQGYFPCERRFS